MGKAGRNGMVWGGLAAAALVVLAVFPSRPAWSARDTVALPGAAQPALGQQGTLTRRAQELLRAAGLYKGPLDGRPSPALTDAILRFQEEGGVEKTGLVTEGLIKKLESATDVRKLERQLTQSRDRQTADAKTSLGRSALLASLGGSPPRRPPVTPKDEAECFDRPNAACLVAVVLNGVKDVDRAELRDWALGDVVAIGVRVGAPVLAHSALLQIDDPRSTLLALRSIAESEGRAGRMTAALSAAADIPDPLRRAEAYASLASILLKTDDHGDALAAVDMAVRSADTLPEPDPSLLASLGVTAAQAGDRKRARVLFDAAARLGDDPEQRALVAAAMADADEPKAALILAEGITAPTLRDSILVAVANAFSRLGDFTAARAKAMEIGAERYRAVALAAVAIDAARKEDPDETRASIDAARAITENIRLPFARSFAQSRVAVAMEVSGDAETGLAMAQAIRDPALRAGSLWTIATHLGEDHPLLLKARHLTSDAVAAIPDPVVRTRTLCTQAADLVARGDVGEGRATLAKAVLTAKAIPNTWVRMRALLAAAETYAEMDAPGTRAGAIR
ncbi:MAG: peptidoglycan-binding protein [Alphaproteobacteria bacterium]|nr:peptidoglycan-binding protein [Alphaproteobacteria bacterium]